MQNLLTGILTAAYPLLVYFTLDSVQPRYLALLPALLFLLRWRQQRQSGAGVRALALLAPACAAFLLAAAIANQTAWLLGYPVLVSLLFLGWFSHSLWYPPTVVERLARLQDPDLPPQGVAYTRKVTLAWCLFFLGNGSISAATVWYGDVGLWTLYNGGLSYVLMGLLMGTELWIRARVRRSF